MAVLAEKMLAFKVVLMLSILVHASALCETYRQQHTATGPQSTHFHKSPVIGMRHPPGNIMRPLAGRLTIITPPPLPTRPRPTAPTLNPIDKHPCEPLHNPCSPIPATSINPTITEFYLPCPTCGNKIVYNIYNTHHHYYAGHPPKPSK